MAITKNQQIRGIRILLTVFYGFLLSSILFRYLVHGIIDTIRSPKNPYAISLIVIGGLLLISVGLSIYATWYDNTTIILVSGIVLIFVFVLTLVFGILRIVNTAPHRVVTETAVRDDSLNADSGSNTAVLKDHKSVANSYEIVEDITGLIIELISILFAILGTFVLFRYVKTKYAAVPTREPAAAT